MQTIQAVFEQADRAESAIGRLQVAGVSPENISLSQDLLAGPRRRNEETLVTAHVDDDHAPKAIAILADEGRVEVNNT